jgi:hypothetical protein
MRRADEPARVSLVAAGAAATCELCTAETAIASTTARIQHPRGGSVQLAACDWCVQAIRRLSAATGGQAIFVLSEAAGPPPSAVLATPRGPRPASPPVLILELTQQVQDAAGLNYVVRVYGRERSDGTWEGWLEFVAVGAAQVLRTGRETTHSSREDLAYWATGLGAAYLEGAFARARRDLSTTSGGL